MMHSPTPRPAAPVAAFLTPRLLALLLLLALLALLAPLAVLAQHRPAPGTPGGAPAPALADALAPDGTLRPDARGSFDATGYRLGTNPATGGPIFRPASPQAPGDENWQDGFGFSGTNAPVYATAVAYTGDVYIGGYFTVVGAVVASKIAKWNGTTWPCSTASPTPVTTWPSSPPLPWRPPAPTR